MAGPFWSWYHPFLAGLKETSRKAAADFLGFQVPEKNNEKKHKNAPSRRCPGLLVYRCELGSWAEAAGLRRGDQLVKLQGLEAQLLPLGRRLLRDRGWRSGVGGVFALEGKGVSSFSWRAFCLEAARETPSFGGSSKERHTRVSFLEATL